MPEERPGQIRLFVACELTDEVRRSLRGIQEDLRRLGADGLRWVRPEAIHLTLKFLGEVQESRLQEIISALASAVEPFQATLRPAGLGGFGGSRLRVVWVGLEGDTEVMATLARRVDHALRPLRFPRERRPFAPHLTLARVQDRVPPPERRRLADLIEHHRLPPQPSMILTEVSLMQSILGPGGSVYHRLASFPKST